MGKLSYNDKLSMQTLWQVSQSHCLVYSERLSQCGGLVAGLPLPGLLITTEPVWWTRGRSPAAWFTQNDWASVVDSWQVSQSHCLVYSERLSQCGGLDCRLSWWCSTSTLCRNNWKWWLSHQVLAHEASACTVCRCKTIFPLVGSTN